MGIEWRIWYGLLLIISIVMPDFKSHNIAMSSIVYLMKTLNGCKDVSLILLQDEQWRRTSQFVVYCNFLALLSTTGCSKNINKQSIRITAFSVGITILNQRII